MMRTARALTTLQQLTACAFWARLHALRYLRRRGFKLWIFGAIAVVGGLALTRAGRRGELGELAVLLITPLCGLFFGTGALRDEIADLTLTYPFTRPVRRSFLYAARVFAVAVPVFVVVGATSAIAASTSGPTTMIRFLLAGFLGAIAYSALFSLIGLLAKWPTWIGLLYLAWEFAIQQVPGFLGTVCLVTHLRSIADLPVRGTFGAYWEPVAVPISLGVIVGVSVICLALGGLWTRQREFRLEK